MKWDNEPEIWRPVPGHEGRYEVSNIGRVKKIFGVQRITPDFKKVKRCRNIKAMIIMEDGSKRSRSIARMVYSAFILGGKEIPKNMIVYHINGIGYDDNIKNLRLTFRSTTARMASAGKRRVIRKIDIKGHVIDIYPSIKAASDACYISQSCVVNRCMGRVAKEFTDGFSFRYDD